MNHKPDELVRKMKKGFMRFNGVYVSICKKLPLIKKKEKAYHGFDFLEVENRARMLNTEKRRERNSLLQVTNKFYFVSKF
jgi:hypothetical protein